VLLADRVLPADRALPADSVLLADRVLLALEPVERELVGVGDSEGVREEEGDPELELPVLGEEVPVPEGVAVALPLPLGLRLLLLLRVGLELRVREAVLLSVAVVVALSQAPPVLAKVQPEVTREIREQREPLEARAGTAAVLLRTGARGAGSRLAAVNEFTQQDTPAVLALTAQAKPVPKESATVSPCR